MAKEETTATLPPKWTDDPLSEYSNQAFRNMLATFVHKAAQFGLLVSIDRHFLNIASNLSRSASILSPLLLMRSHAFYRAASQLAAGGQIAESFCLLRACLECALYCLHIHKDEPLGEAWLRRHDDDSSRKLVRNEFAYGKLIHTLRDVDPKLGETVGILYERTIDFGGHPNERSITASTTMETTDGDIDLQQIYLHADSLSLDHGLKTSAQVGLGALYVLRHVFRERFDILGITSKLDELRQYL